MLAFTDRLTILSLLAGEAERLRIWDIEQTESIGNGSACCRYTAHAVVLTYCPLDIRRGSDHRVWTVVVERLFWGWVKILCTSQPTPVSLPLWSLES